MEALRQGNAAAARHEEPWRAASAGTAIAGSMGGVTCVARELDFEAEADTPAADEFPRDLRDESEEAAPQGDEEADERSERGACGDPEKIYFRQMAAIPRLGQEEEIRIAIGMEYARFRMQALLFATRYGQRKVVELLADSHARHVLFMRAADARAKRGVDEERSRRRFLAACTSLRKLAEKNDRDHEKLLGMPASSRERAEARRQLDRRLQMTSERIRKLRISPMHTLRWTDELVKLTAALRNAHGDSPSAEQDARFRAASYESYAELNARSDALARQYERYCNARNTLSVKNLRLVVSIARRYRYSGIPLLDLIQEGNVGLLRACDGFEYRKGCRFSTYATYWIRQSIGNSVAERSGVIRFPKHAAGLFAKIRTHVLAQFGKHGAMPDMASIAKATDSSEEHIRRFVTLSRGPQSLSNRPDDENGHIAERTTTDHVSAAERAARLATIQENIGGLLDRLPLVDRQIMKLRYGIGAKESWSLRALAGKFDLSPESIRQIEGRTLRKLQRLPSAVQLNDLLD